MRTILDKKTHAYSGDGVSCYVPKPGDKVFLERSVYGILWVFPAVGEKPTMAVEYTWPATTSPEELAHRHYRRHAYWEADYRPAKR